MGSRVPRSVLRPCLRGPAVVSQFLTAASRPQTSLFAIIYSRRTVVSNVSYIVHRLNWWRTWVGPGAWARSRQTTIAATQKGAAPLNVLKVKSTSDPNKVAGALAGTIREVGKAEMQTIGAGALNQAIKSLAIARGFLAPSGVDLVCYPAFVDVDIDGAERTAIRLFIEPR
jgi:stage V sporulation protein S